MWDCSAYRTIPHYVLCLFDRCSSQFTVYGAEVEPLLTEKDTISVNELMLKPSYDALYFIVILLTMYVLLAVILVATSGPHRNKRNIWLSDNSPGHQFAYLLTIKTGNQRHAGTTAKVNQNWQSEARRHYG